SADCAHVWCGFNRRGRGTSGKDQNGCQKAEERFGFHDIPPVCSLVPALGDNNPYIDERSEVISGVVLKFPVRLILAGGGGRFELYNEGLSVPRFCVFLGGILFQGDVISLKLINTN